MMDDEMVLLPLPMEGWIVSMAGADEEGTLITFTNGYVLRINGDWILES
jgi:hypothetical protein